MDAIFPERPQWAASTFWAPELCRHNGIYYVYYVARDRAGTLTIAVATARRPQGPYTDHGPVVGQATGSIDPTHATSEDGRRYLIWKEDGNRYGMPTILWICELTADGLKLVGEATPILRNDVPWEGDVVEAPTLTRRNEYYYMFYSGNKCCGQDCKYAVGVARARNLRGPWEKHPLNPIVAGNASWRCPGHGSIVETAAGRTFYLYHAYSARDSIYVGRQMLLDEVHWESDGWPSVNHGTGPSVSASLPFPSSNPPRPARPRWQWPQETHPIVIRSRGRRVELRAPAGQPSDDVLAATIGRTLPSASYVATVEVVLTSLAPGVQASLVAYGDRDNAVGIGVRDGVVNVFRRSGGRHRIADTADVAGKRRLRFRVIACGQEYRFFYRTGRTWRALGGAVLAPNLTPWDQGIRVSLSVGGTPDAAAEFAAFSLASSRP